MESFNVFLCEVGENLDWEGLIKILEWVVKVM